MSRCSCSIDVDVDEGSVARVSRTSTKIARKEHECQECNHAILPGESYELNTGLFDGKWESFKTCAICKEIRDCFMCSWYYGGIWEEMAEYFRWEEIPICALDVLSKEARSVMIEWLDDILAEDMEF